MFQKVVVKFNHHLFFDLNLMGELIFTDPQTPPKSIERTWGLPRQHQEYVPFLLPWM